MLPSGLAERLWAERVSRVHTEQPAVWDSTWLTGLISTVAGIGIGGTSGDGGPAIEASFFLSSGLAADAVGNLFLTSGNLVAGREFNARIRKVDTVTGLIDAFSGSSGLDLGDGGDPAFALLERPSDVRAVAGGLLIADSGNSRIRGVDLAGGAIRTLAAGDLGNPEAVVRDSNGDLIVAATNLGQVFRISADTAERTLVAGSRSGAPYVDGVPAVDASLNSIQDLALGPDGTLYIAVALMHRVFAVDEAGTIRTAAGSGECGYEEDDVAAASTPLCLPVGLAVEASGALLIADFGNSRIRLVDTSGIITTVAGNGQAGYSGDGGPAREASFFEPVGLALDPQGNLYVADRSFNRRTRSPGLGSFVRVVEAETGLIFTVAGSGDPAFSGDGRNALEAGIDPIKLAVDSNGDLFVADAVNDRIRVVRQPLANIRRVP